jgi:hypothetical protein
MPRQARVDDNELENDQLKDMLDDGVNENESEQQDNEGTGDDEDGSQAQDDKGRGDKETASGEQRDNQRGRDNANDRQQRGRDDKRQQAGRNQGDKQNQQQAQINSALLQKLDEPTRNAVMNEAINFVRARTQPVFNKLEMENRKLKQGIGPLIQASQEAKEYGLQPHERVNAYRMYAAFKKDGIATVKHLITELKKSGKNISFGAEDANNIDLSAIRGMINEALGPVRGDVEARQKQQQALEDAREELINFLGNNPMAQPHVEMLNGILQRYPNETLDTAWLKVQLYAAKKGLSLDVPFNQQRSQQQQNGNRRPMNLRGNRNVQQNGDERGGEITYANPNARWGDIIKESMRAEGYQV